MGAGGPHYGLGNQGSFHLLPEGGIKGTPSDEASAFFPLDLGNPHPDLSLASAPLDLIFMNYFHRNKYITYTSDDQEVWQLEENYMSQEVDCKFVSLQPF